jgi:hypothetical protein
VRVDRRRFEFLHIELSVAVGAVVPRYGLWLFLRARGSDPEQLGRKSTLAFLEHDLDDFLEPNGMCIHPRERRRLTTRMKRFDPRHATPEEVMERMSSRR